MAKCMQVSASMLHIQVGFVALYRYLTFLLKT